LKQQFSKAVFQFSDVISTGLLTDFIGEGETVWGNDLELHCLYSQNISKVTREKYGVSDDVSLVINISVLELEEKTGSKELGERLMETKSGIRILFNNKFYTLDNIRESEYFSAISFTLEMKEEK